MRPVEGWVYCPVCDWAILEFERDLAKADFECAGCGTRNWSEFGPLIDRDPSEQWKHGKGE
jgi:transcription initiation factor TFIIIB Brf1 subunit/transcription initiation factor TFIIB